ncbi:hypothetical protein D3C86_1290400 [compost metagenome]
MQVAHCAVNMHGRHGLPLAPALRNRRWHAMHAIPRAQRSRHANPGIDRLVQPRAVRLCDTDVQAIRAVVAGLFRRHRAQPAVGVFPHQAEHQVLRARHRLAALDHVVGAFEPFVPFPVIHAAQHAHIAAGLARGRRRDVGRIGSG